MLGKAQKTRKTQRKLSDGEKSLRKIRRTLEPFAHKKGIIKVFSTEGRWVHASSCAVTNDD